MTTPQSSYRASIAKLVTGESLSTEGAATLMNDLMEGLLEPAQVAAVLTALAAKGETADELAGFARVMRRHALPVRTDGPTLDTCGTGGSGLETINTSTLAAFVVAAAGVKVAKHGNRASSGKCGSMDVLERLGVNIELTPAQAETLLQQGPIVFMYARRHHPALGQVTPVRRALGFRTCFNFLGPICNPASTELQMMGVSDPVRAPILLESLRQLGTQRAMVVCGEDGLDEISLSAPTQAWELRDGEITTRTITPETAGLRTASFASVKGGDVEENMVYFQAILTGKGGPRADLVALNAAGSLYVAGHAASLAEGVTQAKHILENGAAFACFETYRDATQRVAEEVPS